MHDNVADGREGNDSEAEERWLNVTEVLRGGWDAPLTS